MTRPATLSTGLKDRIRDAAVDLLKQHPEGLRYSFLSRQLLAHTPTFKPATVNSALWNLDALRPSNVFKPSKGLYKHCTHRIKAFSDLPVSREPTQGSPVAESDFYQPIADWLKNELEEVTYAIAFGRNKFRDKWGTSDVIGKRESRRSDVIKAPTEIITEEIKSDTLQLVTAFGQACAYRLYSHNFTERTTCQLSQNHFESIAYRSASRNSTCRSLDCIVSGKSQLQTSAARDR